MTPLSDLSLLAFYRSSIDTICLCLAVWKFFDILVWLEFPSSRIILRAIILTPKRVHSLSKSVSWKSSCLFIMCVSASPFRPGRDIQKGNTRKKLNRYVSRDRGVPLFAWLIWSVACSLRSSALWIMPLWVRLSYRDESKFTVLSRKLLWPLRLRLALNHPALWSILHVKRSARALAFAGDYLSIYRPHQRWNLRNLLCDILRRHLSGSATDKRGNRTPFCARVCQSIDVRVYQWSSHDAWQRTCTVRASFLTDLMTLWSFDLTED